MPDPYNIVMSRLTNLVTRIRVKDPAFDQLCLQHAAITTDIRRLDPEQNPSQAGQDNELRARRAEIEQEMLTVMQANSRM